MVEGPKGPVLVDATRQREGSPPSQQAEVLAIVVRPNRLNPQDQKNAAIFMGLIFISPFMDAISFASARLALKEWLEPEKLPAEDCVLLVQLHPKSQLRPWCVGYPVFLDPIDKDAKADSDDSWVARDVRAFGLQKVCPCVPGSKRPHVMLPHLYTVEKEDPWRTAYVATPLEEGLEVAGPNLLPGGYRIPMAAPSPCHWTVMADQGFTDFCRVAHKKAMASTKDGGGGGLPKPVLGGGGKPSGVPPSRIPDPFPDSPTPQQLRDTTDELLQSIQRIHVDSLYETASVRLVDRLLTDTLMTEFARLTLIVSEDLIASLRVFKEGIGNYLDTFLRSSEEALSHLPCKAVRQEPFRLINELSCSLRRDTASLIITVDMAAKDMGDFLQKRLRDARSVEELLVKGFLDCFQNHFEWIQQVVYHPAMKNPQVSGQVATSLSVLQPLTNFSFTSIVEEVVDRIGLTAQPQPQKGDNSALDRAGSLESAKISDAQFRTALKELCEADEEGKTTKPLWFKPKGLHLDYTEDFEGRQPKFIAPALPLAIFKLAEEEMTLL